jgi:hypothetical protein
VGRGWNEKGSLAVVNEARGVPPGGGVGWVEDTSKRSNDAK